MFSFLRCKWPDEFVPTKWSYLPLFLKCHKHFHVFNLQCVRARVSLTWWSYRPSVYIKRTQQISQHASHKVVSFVGARTLEHGQFCRPLWTPWQHRLISVYHTSQYSVFCTHNYDFLASVLIFLKDWFIILTDVEKRRDTSGFSSPAIILGNS